MSKLVNSCQVKTKKAFHLMLLNGNAWGILSGLSRKFENLEKLIFVSEEGIPFGVHLCS